MFSGSFSQKKDPFWPKMSIFTKKNWKFLIFLPLLFSVTFWSLKLFRNRFLWPVLRRITFFIGSFRQKRARFSQKCQFFRKKLKISGFFGHNVFQWSPRASNFFVIAFYRSVSSLIGCFRQFQREKKPSLAKNVKFYKKN